MLPALGGKLNSTIATLRSRRFERRSATRRAIRDASISARSLQTCISPPISERGEDAGPLAAGAGNAGTIGAAAIDHRPGRAIEFGDRHHDGAFHRHQPAIRGAPLLQRLEFDGMRRRDTARRAGPEFLGRLGVVVGRAADQREAGQRYHRVDHRAAVLHEEALDRRPLVEAAGKRRNHAQSLGFERRDHAVVVAGVAGQQIGPQQQQTNGALLVARRQAADRCVSAIAVLDARVIEADIGIFDRRPRLWQRRADCDAVRRHNDPPAGEPCWRCSRSEPASQYCSVRK